MVIKNDIQIFKNWENPLDVKLELDIFPTKKQALYLRSSLKRSQDNDGVMYSAELKAKSDVSMLYNIVFNS